MYIKRALLILLVLCLSSAGILAQVIFKNSGSNKIFVAYAVMQNGNWNSHGWFPVLPGEEKSVYRYTIFSNQNFYYCAKIENSDQGFYGSTSLYVDQTNAFSIPSADKQQVFSNPNIVPLKFIQLNLRGKTTHTIELTPQNLTLNGQPQGKWHILLDKDGDEALKAEDAEGYREITFESGKPLGWCKDYYADDKVRATYKLLSYRPLTFDGKCTWYKPDGTIEKEIVYQNGQPSIATNFDGAGAAIKKQATYKVVVLPVRDFVVNSIGKEALNNGHSRVPYVVNLPPGTVKWFYEFSAYHDAASTANIKANFKLAASLSKLVDQSGILAASITALGRPPGSSYCNVYVMDDSFYQTFVDGKPIKYNRDASQLNLSSGIVEVNNMTVKNPVIGIANPSSFYSINVSIQIVAIVAEM